MSNKKEHYLGDGLYAIDYGFMIWLKTPREDGEHYVALENNVLEEFLRFVERSRGLKITIERAKAEGSRG